MHRCPSAFADDNEPVPSQSSLARAFDPVVALRGLAAFGAVGVGLSGVAAATGLGVPCPWRSLTGLLCPLCGATHLGMALLRGDLGGAWAANQFVFVGLLALFVLGALWTVEAVGGPAVRPPRALRWTTDAWWLLIGVLAIAFAIWRNLV
jgi:hypothetical protein